MSIPIELKIHNLQQNLINTINSSGLPPAITQYVIKDISDVVQNVAKSEFDRIKNSYMQQNPEYKDPSILDFTKGIKEQMEKVENPTPTPLKENENG